MKQQEKVNFKYGKTGICSNKRARDNASTSIGGVSLGGGGDDTSEVGEFKDGPNIVIKDQPTTNSKVHWKKENIFYFLYWEYNHQCHNLDVTHIEKNVCDNLLGALWNLDGKSKDNKKARKDPEALMIDHIFGQLNTLIETLLDTCWLYYLIVKEGVTLNLKTLKVLDGYALNISVCLNMKDHKISNLKSHDKSYFDIRYLPLALWALGSVNIF